MTAKCHFAQAQQAVGTRATLGQPTDSLGHPRVVEPAISTLPISLPAALQLANARPIDIQLAQQRLAVAAAQLQRAELLWLPNILFGTDYFHHDGVLQDSTGNIIQNSKSTFMIGAAPIAVFATTDAIFGPLAARQDVRARDAGVQAARNDSFLSVAEAYFNVQQARGDLIAAQTVLRHSEELVHRTEKLAPALVPQVEVVRARADLAQREQAVSAARERWRVAGAELGRILRLNSSATIEPVEPPYLQMSLVRLDLPVDDLIPVALTNRPELAQQQALVQATLQRLRQEKIRPLLPSVLLRGASTNPAGTLAAGWFGGGINERIGDFNWRGDWDVQVLWELQNLGFGNHAKVREKQAEHELAILEQFRTQDKIAAEVIQAYAQAQEAETRVKEAEAGLKLAAQSVQENFDGVSQTRRLGGDVVLLVIRPQEVVAAIQALAVAYRDYYAAVADYDRAQFRLYRALGQPAQLMAQQTDGLVPCNK
jgi:outer membrane protein TolC